MAYFLEASFGKGAKVVGLAIGALFDVVSVALVARVVVDLMSGRLAVARDEYVLSRGRRRRGRDRFRSLSSHL